MKYKIKLHLKCVEVQRLLIFLRDFAKEILKKETFFLIIIFLEENKAASNLTK